jgi:hypothetical protein
MLEVTGRSSDGWVSPLSVYVQPAAVPARQRTIDEAARSVGRVPADVRRIYNVVGAIGPQAGGSGLIGDVGSWVDTLTEWAVDLGFDTFIFWPNAAPHSQLATFAGEVVPAVRERVSDRRATKPAAAADQAALREGDRPHGDAVCEIPLAWVTQDEGRPTAAAVFSEVLINRGNPGSASPPCVGRSHPV